MVTTPSFKEYSSGLNSHYSLPGRHKLTSLMQKTVLFVQDSMLKHFTEIPVFSSSTDCWNSKKGTHFLNIIVYWMTADWEYKMRFLTLDPIEEISIKSTVLAKYTNNAFRRFGIQEK